MLVLNLRDVCRGKQKVPFTTQREKRSMVVGQGRMM